MPTKNYAVGYECPDGWKSIVDPVLDELEAMPGIEIRQVKDKFGGLRIYVEYAGGEQRNARAAELITKARELCSRTCQECGWEGSTQNSTGHWVRTICAACNARLAEGKRDPDERATSVLHAGFEGGGLRVGLDPVTNFWFRMNTMSLSFWGEDDDETAAAARWQKNLTWPQVCERLREARWSEMSPVEVADGYAAKVREALKGETVSHGWRQWLDEQRKARGGDDRMDEVANRVVETMRPVSEALGERRVEQMRAFLTGLAGLWEPYLPADIDAVLRMIPKEHWTLARVAADDPSPRVRELAAVLDAAWKRGGSSS